MRKYIIPLMFMIGLVIPAVGIKAQLELVNFIYAAWHPSGNLIAIAELRSGAGEIVVFDENLNIIQTFAPQLTPFDVNSIRLLDLKWSPSGQYLAGAFAVNSNSSYQSYVVGWDSSTWVEQFRYEINGPNPQIAWNPSSNQIFTNGQLIDLSSGNISNFLESFPRARVIVWNPSNDNQLLIGSDSFTLIVEPDSETDLFELDYPGYTFPVYSPNGEYLALYRPISRERIINVDIFETTNYQVVSNISIDGEIISEGRGLQWFDNQTLRIHAVDTDINYIYNITTGQEINQIPAFDREIWHPQGELVLGSGGQLNALIMYDPDEMAMVAQIVYDATSTVRAISLPSLDTQLYDGLAIDIAALNGNDLVLEAQTMPSVIGSVVFNLDGSSTVDNEAPYTFTVPAAIGTYQLDVIPYSGANATGDVGASFPANFTIDNANAGQNCSISIASGDTATLISTINDVNANSIADTICLADGTYTLTASNVVDYGDNGLPLITSDITLVGLGDNVVIERGAGAPAFRLLHVKDTGTLTLENLTLSNGNAGITHGGAVYARGALTLRDVTITGNFARRGGGVRMNGAPLTVTGSTFQNNSADREGGAIYVSGINSPVDLSTSQFTANSATNSGGGFYLSGTSTSLTANDVLFTGNQANGGGAIYAVPSTLNITNATFTSNEALVSSGGAIYTSTDSSVAVANSTFTTNAAGSDGGALRAGGNLTLTGSTLTSNVADVGAAVFSQNAATITGNRIELNAASELGGGLYVSHNGNAHTITGNCISGNTAPQFSGLLGVTANTNAIDNWWGATDGPVSGNTVSANVIFTPFLSACPLD